LDNYITTNGGTPTQSAYGPIYTVSIGNGQTATFMNESASAQGSSGAHWHVVYK